MPRGVKKENLPTKVCVICNRPFNWRKKWERVWDEVTTCSKSCNKKRKQNKNNKGHVVSGDVDRGSTFFETTPDGNFCVIDKEQEDEEVKTIVELEGEVDNDSLLETNESMIVDSLLSQTTLKDDKASTSPNFKQQQLHTVVETTNNSTDNDIPLSTNDWKKQQRKAAKKEKKAARRAQREGRGDPTAGQKCCDMCDKSVDLLIRCTYDESGEWKMVCGVCWKKASGGVVDGDAQHPYYRYGGLWKNRRRGV